MVQHSDRVRFYRLSPDADLTVGSAPDNDVVLRVPGVSRRHASLRRDAGGFVIADLGSKNGLLCNGLPVHEAALGTGRTVQLGEAFLTVEEISSSDGEAALLMNGPRVESSSGSRGETGAQDAVPSPASALRLVRELEHAFAAGGVESAWPLLDRARCLLAASALALVRRDHHEGVVVHRCWGALVEADVDAVEAALGADNTGAGESRVLAAPRIVDNDKASALVAVFPATATPLPSWVLDLFSYLGERVANGNALAPAALDRPREQATNDLVFPPGMVVGSSPAMRGLLQQLRATVKSGLDVLLVGETGTGKELIARAIHASGPTGKGPFVAINCAAIPGELLEAELFGVVARVATGVDPRPGLFVQAEGGTLLLDEIGEMPERLQAKLLRVLQEREVLPLGSSAPRRIRVRVISASNRNIAQLAEQGQFRADLYYRLRGLQFHLPPLRERREDVAELVIAFGTAAARKYGKQVRGVSRRALAVLMEHGWPGNVRELETEVERAVLLCPDGGVLESRYFAPIRWASEQRSAVPTLPPATAIDNTAEISSLRPLQEQIDALERQAILAALAASRGNRSRAARILGITRNGLSLKLKRLGIE